MRSSSSSSLKFARLLQIRCPGISGSASVSPKNGCKKPTLPPGRLVMYVEECQGRSEFRLRGDSCQTSVSFGCRDRETSILSRCVLCRRHNASSQFRERKRRLGSSQQKEGRKEGSRNLILSVSRYITISLSRPRPTNEQSTFILRERGTFLSDARARGPKLHCSLWVIIGLVRAGSSNGVATVSRHPIVWSCV